MKIIVQMISTNKEQPVFTIDTDKLSISLSKKVMNAIPIGELFLGMREFNEIHDAFDHTPYPYEIHGIIEIISDF